MSPVDTTIRPVASMPTSAVKATQVLSQELLNNGGYRSIDTELRKIFPTPQEETRVQQARAILGEVGKQLPDEEIEVFLTRLQLMIDSWLDIYEQDCFEGLTLREILIGK